MPWWERITADIAADPFWADLFNLDKKEPLLRREPAQKEWGRPSILGRDATDFDYCFKFVLPGSTRLFQKQAVNKLERAGTIERVSSKERISKQEKENTDKLAHMYHEMAEESQEASLQFAKKTRAHIRHLETGEYPDEGCSVGVCCAGKDHSTASTVSRTEVELLFKRLFIGAEDAAQFTLDEFRAEFDIDSARELCISLILDFFRRREEAYHTFMFTSKDGDELFLCVKMLQATAAQHAEVSKYCVRLGNRALSEHLGIAIEHLPGPKGPGGPALMPAYVEYVSKKQVLYARHLNETDRIRVGLHRHDYDPLKRPCCKANQCSIFRKVDTLQILYDRVTDVLNIDAMVDWNLLICWYPLHTQDALKPLMEEWANMRLWYRFGQPLDEIRNYFGEQIALYFLFLSVLCRHLRWLVGFGFIVIGVAAHSYFQFISSPENGGAYDKRPMWVALLGGDAGDQWLTDTLQILLAVFTMIWTQVFVRNLKQEVDEHLNIWGMDNPVENSIKSQQNQRFADKARICKSETDANKLELQVGWRQRFFGRRYSRWVTIFFILATLFCSSGIFSLKAWLLRQEYRLLANLCSYLLTIQIKVFNAIWARLAVHVTDYEYYAEEIEFCNALSWKMYMFEFINDFCSFYYIAFVMRNVEGECPVTYGTCWGYLTYQMAVVFGVFLLFILYDIFYPMWVIKSAIRAEVNKLRELGRDVTASSYSYIEQQSKMDCYNAQASIDDYIGVISPLSFVLLFGITMPISSLLLLITIALQIRADGWKLTRATQRPYPMPAHLGLGVWLSVLELLSWAAMITNVALVCFTVRPFAHWHWKDQTLLFVAGVLSVAIVKVLLSVCWQEATDEVLLARKRHAWQREKTARWRHSWAYDGAEDPNKGHISLVANCKADFAKIPGLETGDTYFEAPLLAV